jgi:hypothetical protein
LRAECQRSGSRRFFSTAHRSGTWRALTTRAYCAVDFIEKRARRSVVQPCRERPFRHQGERLFTGSDLHLALNVCTGRVAAARVARVSGSSVSEAACQWAQVVRPSPA